MACYHPNKAFQFGIGSKPTLLPSPMKVSKEEYQQKLDLWQYTYDSQTEYPRALLLPCKQCIGCRISYTRNWAIRCLLEAKMHPADSCWFVTLTYDDDNLPRSAACDINTGEFLFETGGTLVPYHLTQFLKNFRERLRHDFHLTGVRFYACGEYGTLSKRPHYHLIIFGVPYSKDLFKPFKYQSGSCELLEMPLLTDTWGKGMCPIGKLTYDSASYVAGYMLKKVKGKESQSYYDMNGIVPEFSRMSTHPGLAGGYFEMYSDDIYKSDSLGLKLKSGLVAKPPEYFDRLYKVEHADEFYTISAKRQHNYKESMQFLLERAGMTEQEYLEKAEYNLKYSCRSALKKTI